MKVSLHKKYFGNKNNLKTKLFFHTRDKVKELMVMIMVLFLLLTSASAIAGKNTGTLNVTVTVIETGSVRSPDMGDFSYYNPANPVDSTTTQGYGTFRCAKNKCSKRYITRANTMTTKLDALHGSFSETVLLYIYTVEY
ncbi:MAG: hypothetical protein AMJ61_14965 [Desulfobacterales bacterium SG8_35_2]|nr:MAG: hypothetical protein AMJ61_14965 [Desulfobacterales bacterium SG8_35_2]